MCVLVWQLEGDSRSGSSLSLRQLTNSHHRNMPGGGAADINSSNASQAPAGGMSKVQRSVSATAQKPTSRRFSVGGEESGESRDAVRAPLYVPRRANV